MLRHHMGRKGHDFLINSMPCLHRVFGNKVMSMGLWPPFSYIRPQAPRLTYAAYWIVKWTVMVLALKMIWKTAFRVQCFQFQQQNFKVQWTTCFWDVTSVCVCVQACVFQPRENTSSIFLIYGRNLKSTAIHWTTGHWLLANWNSSYKSVACCHVKWAE